MYERFYGFREPAFELTSNPKFLFFTANTAKRCAISSTDCRPRSRSRS